MIVLNNVASPDAYTQSSTIVGLSIETLSLFVFNNAVTIQVAKKNPGGGQDVEWLPEQNIAPGSVQFPGAVGVRFKNALAGQIARIILVAPEYDKNSPDPGMVGYTPTTLQLTASGGIGVVASPYYQRNSSLVDVTTPAGNVETDILNCPIKAADITANSRFEYKINCDMLDSVADATLTIRAYIGATKILDSGAVSMAMGGAPAVTRQPISFLGSLFLRGALNSQWFDMYGQAVHPATAALPTGEGVFLANNAIGQHAMANGAAVDMSIDQTFRITAFMSLNDANHSLRKFGSLVTLY